MRLFLIGALYSLGLAILWLILQAVITILFLFRLEPPPLIKYTLLLPSHIVDLLSINFALSLILDLVISWTILSFIVLPLFYILKSRK